MRKVFYFISNGQKMPLSIYLLKMSKYSVSYEFVHFMLKKSMMEKIHFCPVNFAETY